MRVRRQFNRAAGGWLVGIAALLVPLLAACTSSTPAPTATQLPTTSQQSTAAQPPTATVTAVPTPTAAPTSTVTAVPTPTAAPTSTPSATATPAFDPDRETGTYQGVTFLVGEGSEATFTVGEELTLLPLPNDAVMRTMAPIHCSRSAVKV